MLNNNFNLDLDTAEIGGGKQPKLPNGVFDVVFDKFSYSPSKLPNKPNAKKFVAEFTVETVISQQPSPRNPAVATGTKRAFVVYDDNKKAAGNILELCVALMGLDPSQEKIWKQATSNGEKIVWNEVAKLLLSEQNPFAGQKLRVSTTELLAQGSNPSYMLHKWSPNGETRQYAQAAAAA